MQELDKKLFYENGYTSALTTNNKKECKNLLNFAEWHIIKRKILKKLKIFNNLPQKYFKGNAHLSSKQVVKVASDKNILDDVSMLLGPDILLWIAYLIVRVPGGKPQSWHIDENNKVVNGIHVSIALTDMNVNNGCLYVIPKTHNYEENLIEISKNKKCDLNNFTSVLKLADNLHPENAPHQILPIELKKGQYFLMHSGLWHAVNRNQTSKSRIVMIARFMRPDIQNININNGRTLSRRCILVRGEDNFNFNSLYEIPRTNKL